jgi:hypothetical protein
VLTVSFIKAIALFLVFSNFVRDTLDKAKEKSGIPRSRDLENMQPSSALLIETEVYNTTGLYEFYSPQSLTHF